MLLESNEDLLRKYRNTTDTEEKTNLLNSLYHKNEKYIKSLVKSLVRYSESFEFDDCMGYAAEGFMHAVQKYNFNDSCSFVSCMSNYIKKYIYKALYGEDKMISIPEYLRPAVREIHAGTDFDIVLKNYGINEECLVTALRVCETPVCSLDEDTDSNYSLYFPSESDNEDEKWVKKYRYVLNRDETKLMDTLISPDGNMRSLKEISQILKISVKKARELKDKCFVKIRKSEKSFFCPKNYDI